MDDFRGADGINQVFYEVLTKVGDRGGDKSTKMLSVSAGSASFSFWC